MLFLTRDGLQVTYQGVVTRKTIGSNVREGVAYEIIVIIFEKGYHVSKAYQKVVVNTRNDRSKVIKKS